MHKLLILLALTFISIQSHAKEISDALLVESKTAVAKKVHFHFGDVAKVSFLDYTVKEGKVNRVTYMAKWTEESVDFSGDAVDPVWFETVLACQLEVTYFVDSKEVFLGLGECNEQ